MLCHARQPVWARDWCSNDALSTCSHPRLRLRPHKQTWSLDRSQLHSSDEIDRSRLESLGRWCTMATSDSDGKAILPLHSIGNSNVFGRMRHWRVPTTYRQSLIRVEMSTSKARRLEGLLIERGQVTDSWGKKELEQMWQIGCLMARWYGLLLPIIRGDYCWWFTTPSRTRIQCTTLPFQWELLCSHLQGYRMSGWRVFHL